jgi:hypothetical protein
MTLAPKFKHLLSLLILFLTATFCTVSDADNTNSTNSETTRKAIPHVQSQEEKQGKSLRRSDVHLSWCSRNYLLSTHTTDSLLTTPAPAPPAPVSLLYTSICSEENAFHDAHILLRAHNYSVWFSADDVKWEQLFGGGGGGGHKRRRSGHHAECLLTVLPLAALEGEEVLLLD